MKSSMTNQPGLSGRKMRHAWLGLIPALILLCLAAASEPGLSTSNNEPNAPKLEGSWLVTVTVEGVGTWEALESYNAGGAVMASDSGPWPLYPMNSAFHGAWARKGDRQFVLKMMNFQYDNAEDGYPDGLAKNIVKHRLTIGNGGNTYAGNGTVEWYDSTGSLIAAIPFTTVAARILAE